MSDRGPIQRSYERPTNVFVLKRQVLVKLPTSSGWASREGATPEEDYTPMELVHLSRAIPQPTLGAGLRAARLGRNITIEAVAARTKLNPGFFRDLERDDLSKWPANQFYR